MVGRRDKKTGVPTRDKLSKAIAMVQSSRKKPGDNERPELSLTIPVDGGAEQQRQTPATGGSNQEPFLLNAFSSRAADGRGGLAKPPPTQHQTGKKNQQPSNFADHLYKAIHKNQQGSDRPDRPLTPRAAAAAAAKKSREQASAIRNRSKRVEKEVSSSNTSITSSGGPPLTPRAAAATAIASEKRKNRARKAQPQHPPKNSKGRPQPNRASSSSSGQEGLFSKKSIEEALVTVASYGNGRSSVGKESGHPLKVSTDIERDIQATSQTLAKISQFIDTVTKPTAKEKQMQRSESGEKGNNSFLNVYKRNLDDSTIDSNAAIAEEAESRDQTSSSHGAEIEEREPSQRPSSDREWNRKVYRNEMRDKGRIYIAENQEFDSQATYASKPASSVTDYRSSIMHRTDPFEPQRKSPAISMYMASVKTPEVEEVVDPQTPRSKPSSFAALLSAVSASSFDTRTASRQIPIQVLPPEAKSDTTRDKNRADERVKTKKSPLASKSSSKERPRVESIHKPSGLRRNNDPPNRSIPFRMTDKDELKKKKSSRSFDSDSTFDEDGSLETPQNPAILSEISAFIDRVEQKNKETKRPSPILTLLPPEEGDAEDEAEQQPSHSEYDDDFDLSAFATMFGETDEDEESVHQQHSLNDDLDAAALATMFDEPITPRSRCVGLEEKKFQSEKKEDVGSKMKEVLDTVPTAKSEATFAEFTSLSSSLPGNDPTWREMEMLLNNIAIQAEKREKELNNTDDKDDDADSPTAVEDEETPATEDDVVVVVVVEDATSPAVMEEKPSAEDVIVVKDASSETTPHISVSSGSSALSKEDDPICLIRGDLAAEDCVEKKNSPAGFTSKPRLQIDPSTGDLSFQGLPNVSTPTSKPRAPSASKRRADPPPEGRSDGETRSREDPPEEGVPSSSTISTTGSHTDIPGQQLEPSPTHEAGPTVDTVDTTSNLKDPKSSPTRHKLAEVMGKRSASKHRTRPPKNDKASSPRQRGPPKPQDLKVINVEDPEEIEAAAKEGRLKVNALRINTQEAAKREQSKPPRGGGTELTPIIVISPSAAAKASPLFVDLTAVGSGDICKETKSAITPKASGSRASSKKAIDADGTDFHAEESFVPDLHAEESFVKAWMKSDLNRMSEEQIVEELLLMTDDSPRKSPSKAGSRAFDFGVTVESDGEDGSDGETGRNKSSGREFSHILDGSKEQDRDATGRITKDPNSVMKAASLGSINPPGEYAGSGDEDVAKGSREDKDLSKQDSLEALVNAPLGEMFTESEDDRDPMQSLLFAQKNDVAEMAGDRKEAGLSLIKLTLDEVKNFVDSNISGANSSGAGVISQKVKELERQDGRIPSLLTDMGEDTATDISGSQMGQSDNIFTDNDESVDDRKSVASEQCISVKYDFQPASSQPISSQVFKNETEAAVVGKEKRPGQKRNKFRKGLKRKFSTDEENEEGSAISAPTTTSTNWLASLDSIFSCKQPIRIAGQNKASNGSPTGNASQAHRRENKSRQVEGVHSEYSFASEIITSQSNPSPRERYRPDSFDVKSSKFSFSSDVYQSRSHLSPREQDRHSFPAKDRENSFASDVYASQSHPLPEENEAVTSADRSTSDEDHDEHRQRTTNDTEKTSHSKAERETNDSSGGSSSYHSAREIEAEGETLQVAATVAAGTGAFESSYKNHLNEGKRSSGNQRVPESHGVSDEEEQSVFREKKKPIEKPQSKLCETVEDMPPDEIQKSLSQMQTWPLPVSIEEEVVTPQATSSPQATAMPQATAQVHTCSEEVERSISPLSHRPGDDFNEERTLPASDQVTRLRRTDLQEKAAGRRRLQAPHPPDLLKFASQSGSMTGDVVNMKSISSAELGLAVPAHTKSSQMQGTTKGVTSPTGSSDNNATTATDPPEQTTWIQAIDAPSGTGISPKGQIYSSFTTEKFEVVIQEDDERNDTEVSERVVAIDPDADHNVRPTSPGQSKGWDVDLTDLGDDEGTVEEGIENAWVNPVDLGSLQEESLDLSSWEKPTVGDKKVQNETSRPQVEPLNTKEADATSASRDIQTPRDDPTPRMHQNKRFDFIEEVNEEENISAYFSRMTNLKQGGHLPGLDIKALGSIADNEKEEDTDNVEVDLDVGFVKKSLAPELSQDPNTWEEEDEDGGLVEGRYVSIEESSESDDNHSSVGPKLDTISDDDEDDDEDHTSHGGHSSSFLSSCSSADDEESLGSSSKHPIVVESGSMVDEMQDKFPGDDGVDDANPSPALLEAYRSLSYESDNDEWLRKRDLATRKTQNPTSWLTRTASGIQSKLSFVTVETPKAINGVAAAKKLLSRTVKRRGGRRRNPIPPTLVWKSIYKERTKDHPGYFDVDFFSLFNSSAVGAVRPHHLDSAPWESRDVRQHFLHEHSISFSKNWFGKAQRTRGNERIKERVAHPKSMEMPMENKPHPEEWTEEWYKTWEAPKGRTTSRSVSSSYTGSDKSSDGSTNYIGSSASYSTAGNFTASECEDDRSYYEDTPQCGELINVKPKIGERVTRIHPDYTSQLRRSRWRKKYFPRGTFPY
ncbi:expressed unknown protein [Seminavis robusta]|uniref:Uncharacterized protein n=1 Tax=Seminavis robusta TaxID=568900 RepID=A0A9N8HLQ8_9STRA|nr:expressed unknown protein [Seminavis robusta]|eukprot:Sro831_g208360.1 n/a (2531) ;mRNA; r:25166-32924